MATITITTTHGNLEFEVHGANMTVLNTSTGKNLYSGDPDQRVINAMSDQYDSDYAARVGQEWADEFYAD